VIKTLLARKEHLEQTQKTLVLKTTYFVKVLAVLNAVSSKFANTYLLMLTYCVAQPGRGADSLRQHTQDPNAPAKNSALQSKSE
jgi:hypothetical protein